MAAANIVGVPPAELVGAYGFPAVFCASLALSSPPAVADVKNPLHHASGQLTAGEKQFMVMHIQKAKEMVLEAGRRAQTWPSMAQHGETGKGSRGP
ncbi:MAG: hypothetical protein FRX49_02704 [Trebouxia sp. A1-2]|nr:MAG: hypothetical protein FRX49_02704 [Trebouxia sp. A1-2]